MEKRYSLVKAGIWYTAGNILIKGLPFFTLPIFVRLLTTADFGLYNTYISYENITSVVVGLGFSGSVKTAKFDFKENFEQYITSLYMFLLIVITVAIPLFVWLSAFFGVKGILSPDIVLILMLHSFCTSIFTINGIKFVIQGRYKQNLFFTLVNTVLNIGISLLLCFYVFTENRYLGRIMGTAVSFFAVTCVILLFQIRKTNVVFNKNYNIYALKIGIPLIPHLVSMTILSSCDKIMIQNMVGNSEAGIYSLAVNMTAVVSVLASSIENAWAPWFYGALHEERHEEIVVRNNKLLLLFSYVSSGFVLAGNDLIKIFSTTEYFDSLYALIPLTISIFFNFVYLIPVNLEYNYKKVCYISIATVMCVVLNVALDFVFIKQLGYIYAAHATCISKLSLLVFHMFIAKKMHRRRLFSAGTFGFSVLLLVSCALLAIRFSDNMAICRGGVLIILIIAVLQFIKERKQNI